MGVREQGDGGKDNKIVSGGPEVRMRTLKKKCPEELMPHVCIVKVTLGCYINILWLNTSFSNPIP